MKILSIAFVFLASLTFVGCGQKPITDADIATQYGLSLEEYQEQKEAAARMNMSIEDHLNMGHGGDHNNPNYSTDSMPESDIDSHEKAAADMGMTLEEHEASGHPGH